MFRTTSVAVAAIAAASLLGACGSNSASSPGSSGHLTYAQAQQDAVNFADCIRSHDVPNFPDPTSPREFKVSMSPNSPAAHSPAFMSAARACRHLLRGGGAPDRSAPHTQAQIAETLAFARCLRGHGFPSFPDPTSGGQLTHEMLAQAGISVQQPALVRAADACVGVTHGFITRAAVARFAAGQ